MTSGTMRLAFLDLVFNLLLGITLMFVISFIMINPPAQTGQIDPPISLIVEMEWSEKSLVDIDLWARGKDGDWVGFKRKDGRYFVLERDDRGTSNDVITINGETRIIQRNYEAIRFTLLPPGEYVINVHYFSSKGPAEEIEVNLTRLSPYDHLFTGSVILKPHQQITVVSFVVNEYQQIVDIRTDVQIPHLIFDSESHHPPAGERPW